MENIAEFGDRTITVSTDNPCYSAILEGWVRWGHLHDRPGLGKVTMSVDPVTRVLRFAVSAPESADLGDAVLDFYDLVMGAARAWQDTFTTGHECVEVGGIGVYAERNSKDRRVSQHYTHADVTLATPHAVVSLPGLSVAELRTLGLFLTDYADAMEDDHRDDLA